MQMTFDQYIVNPMGIKNSVYSNREIYRDLYTKKLDAILVREVGKVKHFIYKSKDNKYYVYMKIPSEVIKNFYYDTVVEFYTDKPEALHSRSLKDYYVKFYSNDPSFVYTFAHAMLANDMFIRDLIPRMSKQAIKQAAVIKNPKNEIGYVKSLYFTYILMKSYGLFNKVTFEANAEKYNKKMLIDMIEPADDKVEKRQNAQSELNKEKQNKKKRAKIKNDFEGTDNVSVSKKSNNINNISKTKRIGYAHSSYNNMSKNKTMKVKTIGKRR